MPSVRRKLKCLDGALGMNPCQLVNIAFKVCPEKKGIKADHLFFLFFFLEAVQGNQKERQDPKGKWKDPLGANQWVLVQRGRPVEKEVPGTQKEKKNKKGRNPLQEML